MSTNNKKNTKRGFTLVEMVIIAPIVILVIGIFIYTIITMTGDVMAGRAANVLAYNIQDALNRIEADFKISDGYLSTNSFDIQLPQGLDSTTTKFTTAISGTITNSPLIIKSYATDKNPLSADRNVIHKKGTLIDCSNPALVAQNEILIINIVYFVKDGTLWRRIIMPSDYTSPTSYCGTPWQQPSCTTGWTESFCKTDDERLIDGLESTNGLQITYNTSKVDVTINATATMAGRSITKSGTISAINVN